MKHKVLRVLDYEDYSLQDVTLSGLAESFWRKLLCFGVEDGFLQIHMGVTS
jgi:hypothetical protein